MKLKSLTVALAVMACVIPEYSVLAQATVNENESLTLYVNGATGVDKNVGTATEPFATIQAAVNAATVQNRKGVGVKVLVSAGTYREAVTVGYRSTSAALTIQAATPGTAIIDGANVLKSPLYISGSKYVYAWADTVAGCALPTSWYTGMPSIVNASEMLFVNGIMLTQVSTAGQLRAGTFYVNPAIAQIQVYPAADTDMSTALVEVASRRTTFTSNAASNLVVRGLVLQHGANCMNTSAATVNSGTNVLFDSVVAQWNNWSGLGFNSSTNITVQNTIANNNGGAGLAAFENIHGVWQNDESDYNNWRGAMVGLYDFGQGGTKIMRLHGGSVTNLAAYNNQAQGLWFDTDNQNVTVSNAALVGNLVGNMQIEANQGPITVENSTFCTGAGLQVLESTNVTLTGNTFYANGGLSFQNGQLFLGGQVGGRVISDWQTHVSTNLVTGNMTLSENNFVAANPSQYVFNTYLTGNDWSTFANTLKSNDNVWTDASNPVAFGVPLNKKVSMSGWQNMVGQDLSSVFSAVAPSTSSMTSCKAPQTTYPDFQLQAHNAASYVSSYVMSKGVVQIPLQVNSFGYGPVSLSVYGLPAGVKVAFSAISLTSGSSVMTLTAAKTASPQKVPMEIFGVSGGRVHSVSVWVTVAPPA